MEDLENLWCLTQANLDVDQSYLSVSKLRNNVFMRLCDVVNSGSKSLRAKACTLLGTIRYVRDGAIKQTLNKEKEKQSDVNFPSSAYGIFVHGLEDEYQEIRNAALDAMCELSIESHFFGKSAVDFMVDMFNDEMEGTALMILDDANRAMRIAGYQLLSISTIAGLNELSLLLTRLNLNFKRYIYDLAYIYKCMAYIGRNHPTLIELLYDKLLRLDSRFLPHESSLENRWHAGLLILIFNAAVYQPSILRNLPLYAFRQFNFLVGKYPYCFPLDADLKTLGHLSYFGSTQGSSLFNVRDPPSRAIALVFTQVQELYALIREKPEKSWTYFETMLLPSLTVPVCVKLIQGSVTGHVYVPSAHVQNSQMSGPTTVYINGELSAFGKDVAIVFQGMDGAKEVAKIDNEALISRHSTMAGFNCFVTFKGPGMFFLGYKANTLLNSLLASQSYKLNLHVKFTPDTVDDIIALKKLKNDTVIQNERGDMFLPLLAAVDSFLRPIQPFYAVK
ncbi:hypothetical protein HDV05_005622 [Chytridiales sp. JEL 0842]|nr:hypothetical protein HDV05_005622 [Chytridiales sp. JEL 0842]